MEDLRLCDSEYRFMCLVWELSPVRSGDLVNIENDVIGKYVERLLAPLTYDQPKSTVTKEFLARCGY